MWGIWAKQLLPQSPKNCNKSPNLVTLSAMHNIRNCVEQICKLTLKQAAVADAMSCVIRTTKFASRYF